jgi:hypothetical protein
MGREKQRWLHRATGAALRAVRCCCFVALVHQCHLQPWAPPIQPSQAAVQAPRLLRAAAAAAQPQLSAMPPVSPATLKNLTFKALVSVHLFDAFGAETTTHDGDMDALDAALLASPDVPLPNDEAVPGTSSSCSAKIRQRRLSSQTLSVSPKPMFLLCIQPSSPCRQPARHPTGAPATSKTASRRSSVRPASRRCLLHSRMCSPRLLVPFSRVCVDTVWCVSVFLLAIRNHQVLTELTKAYIHIAASVIPLRSLAIVKGSALGLKQPSCTQ